MRYFTLLMLFLVACTAKANRYPVPEQRLLFILHADSASIEFAQNTSISGVLHLHDVNDTVSFFSERPNRRAGKLTLKRFLEHWNRGEDSFSLEPPNAGLVFFSPSDSPSSRTAHYSEVSLTLENPRYNRSQDRLSFDVTLLSTANPIPADTLLEPTLFIDTGSR